MAVLVPPTVLEKVQAVLDPPVIADMTQELSRSDPIGIEAGDEVSYVMTNKPPVPGRDQTVHTQRDAAGWEGELVPVVRAVFQVAPQATSFAAAPFFSVVSTSA